MRASSRRDRLSEGRLERAESCHLGNDGTFRAVRPDWKINGIDRQTYVMEQDEESEDRHPGEVQHETRRRREEEREEEAEPKSLVGKYEGGGCLRDIGAPSSKKEVEEHYLTHVPYRNWCSHSQCWSCLL